MRNQLSTDFFSPRVNEHIVYELDSDFKKDEDDDDEEENSIKGIEVNSSNVK